MSDTNQPTFTKTCSSCGLQKPLSAFLELSGDNAGSYGNICGSCRKAHQNKEIIEEGDSTKSDSGHKIDGKTKIVIDIDAKEKHHRAEEEYHEERDENEIIDTEILDKRDNKAKDERKHRESFLNKPSYLTDKKQSTPTTAGRTQVAPPEKSLIASQNEAQAEQGTVDHARAEQRKNELNLTGPLLETDLAGKEKGRSVIMRQYATWLGKGSAIGRMHASKQPATPADQTKDPTLSEFVEKTMGPKSKR